MLNIKIVTIGHIPAELNLKALNSWKSKEFKISDTIENFSLTSESDGCNWEFSDGNLERQLPEIFPEDFLMAIVNVPLENNWYSRILSNDRVVLSLHEIKDILNENNIPPINIVHRLLYVYTLLFKRAGNRIPHSSERYEFTHDETRHCLFDMNGIKTDIIYSCHQPIICSSCIEKMRKERVSDNAISQINKEIKKIQKPLFFRVADFVKKHPIISLTISVISALIIGTASSIISSIILKI